MNLRKTLKFYAMLPFEKIFVDQIFGEMIQDQICNNKGMII